MGYFAWKPYVPVAKRRAEAAKVLAGMRKRGAPVAPVVTAGRTIATSFWGKAWCQNLERYSDFESRLPRGRTYVRNGSVLDLQMTKGEITAKVMGSELYDIKITIAPVAAQAWKAICGDCAGNIDSVVELLQGRIAKGVMDRVCREGDGLFPAPKAIKLSCSCPDWADMCKHVAAALYGVGARLDVQPELLFVLRGADAKDMISGAAAKMAATKRSAKGNKVLADDDLAALFGLDMAGEAKLPPDAAVPAMGRKLKAVAKTMKSEGGRKAKVVRKPVVAPSGFAVSKRAVAASKEPRLAPRQKVARG